MSQQSLRSLLRLCLVTNLGSQPFTDAYKRFLAKAIKGGVTLVQLREPLLEAGPFLALAREMKQFLDTLNTPLIINNHVDIASEIDAAGAHIGQADLTPEQARKILDNRSAGMPDNRSGEKKILGLSVNSLEQLEAANKLSSVIDYIGVTVFYTNSKPDCKPWGLDGLRQAVALSQHPVIAIGGIDTKNVKIVRQTGVSGIAVISVLHDNFAKADEIARECSLI